MENIRIDINLKSFEKLVGDIVNRMSHLSASDVLFILVAVFLPPLAVFLKQGIGVQFWINVILTVLGYVPGQLHALWVVLMM